MTLLTFYKRNRKYNEKKDYGDLILERIEEGIYSENEVIGALMRWIGLGNNRDFREILHKNEMLLNDDE